MKFVPSQVNAGAFWSPAPTEIGSPPESSTTPEVETRLPMISVFERLSAQATR